MALALCCAGIPALVQALTVTGVTVTPSPAPPGSSAVISCTASDDVEVTGLRLTVSGGTLPSGGSSEQAAITPGAQATGSLAWVTPAPGSYAVTCDATGASAGAASLSVAAIVQALPPVVESAAAPEGPYLAGETYPLAVTARDPQGSALTYAWSATAGQLAAAEAQASWTAPSSAGQYTVTATVTNAFGLSATRSFGLGVVLSAFQSEIGAALVAPGRIAVGESGEIYAVNGRDDRLFLFTRRGDLRASVRLPDVPVAVAAGPERLFVSTRKGRILVVEPTRGRVVGEYPGSLGSGPVGLAYDSATGLLWVAHQHGNFVAAIRANGSVAVTLKQAGTVPLREPIDVAVDPRSGTVWVSLETNESATILHAFTREGTYLRSAVRFGTYEGQIVRAGGITVDGQGQVYVADIFQGVVAVLSPSGVFMGNIGVWGAGAGELKNPTDVAHLANGDTIVANLGTNSLVRFGKGAELPTCAGDSDCDGLPDDWELAHGLDPRFAGDGLLDADGDGLDNLEELALGTDPSRRDTDGDGASDGDEVLAGTDPLQGPKPVLAVSCPSESDPGLVSLSSTLGNAAGACTMAWRQTSGPTVALRAASSTSPSFVARTAGTYAFEAVATCGGTPSDPASTSVEIRNVPPRAEPGRMVVLPVETPLVLDGGFSRDANGDALWLAWTQTVGAPLAASASLTMLTGTPSSAGFLSFQLTATDPAGRSGSAEVRAYAVPGTSAPPTAIVSTPVFAAVGDTVTLDATRSITRAAKPSFQWVQTGGPPVSIANASTSTAAFAPPMPGRYRFEVGITDSFTVPPAAVDVFVTAPGAALPAATPRASVALAAAGEPVTLDAGETTGAGLTYAWRQIAGPAAGLTDGDLRAATVVPFEAGHYRFELVVAENGIEGQPAQVWFDADAPGQPRPIARVAAPAPAVVGGVAQLDGTASGGGSAPLAYRWTQVSGPWVALANAATAAPSFKPGLPGEYGFELEVDDGTVRSAPASVTVTVSPKK